MIRLFVGDGQFNSVLVGVRETNCIHSWQFCWVFLPTNKHGKAKQALAIVCNDTILQDKQECDVMQYPEHKHSTGVGVGFTCNITRIVICVRMQSFPHCAHAHQNAS